MPQELQKELRWGMKQVETIPKNPQGIVEMALGLIEDSEYRQDANSDIATTLIAATGPEAVDSGQTGKNEVSYATAMWDGDFNFAFETATAIAESASDADLAGYRGWWWYLASVAASLADNKDAEREALWRASKAGVYTGFAGYLLSKRTSGAQKEAPAEEVSNVEAIWDTIQRWGWNGPKFEQKMGKLKTLLGSDAAAQFHQGLELLGECLGAIPTRKTNQGVPDVVWSFGQTQHFAFEAKTDKQSDGTLYKKDLLEAKGHADWVRTQIHKSSLYPTIGVVIISPTSALDPAAKPFTQGLHIIATKDLREIAAVVVEALRTIRARFTGKDFADSQQVFAAHLKAANLDFPAVRAFLFKTKLGSES